MAEFDYQRRKMITEQRKAELKLRVEKLSGKDRELADKLLDGYLITKPVFLEIYGEVLTECVERPSLWYTDGAHQALLDVFVPQGYQRSYLYIIDKINQFPFTRGMGRRCVRTASYGPQFSLIFSLLRTYWNLFYCEEALENFLLGNLSEEKLDYMRCEYYLEHNFSYLYAAELDLGNEMVTMALRDVMVSEQNTTYLSREMVLGILRSDHTELQDLLCKLLLAARLQEGLRQTICENMDAGTTEAFLKLLQVIEEHDLIRFSAVKRAVFTFIGIYDENHVERIAKKLLELMGQCLRDRTFCEKQLQTEDAVAINTALWAIGFYEAQDAISAMQKLIEQGSRHQKLAASVYQGTLYDDDLKMMTARKVVLEYRDDLELVAAYLPTLEHCLQKWLYNSFEDENRYTRELRKPKVPVLTSFYKDREEAEAFYQCFLSICEQLPKKGVYYQPFIFPWYEASFTPSELVEQLAFLAYLLQEEEKITYIAGRLLEVTGYRRDTLINLLLYKPSNQAQRELAIQYMGNASSNTSEMATRIVKKMTIKGDEEYLLLEKMLRFKRSALRTVLLEFLMEQEDEKLTACISRLLKDKKEEKRSAGLDLLLRLSKEKEREALYQQAKSMVSLIAKPTDKEKVMIQELSKETKDTATEKPGYGIYDREKPEELLVSVQPEDTVTPEQLLALCMPISEQEAIEKMQKLDKLVEKYKDYEYTCTSGNKYLLGNEYWSVQTSDIQAEYGRLGEYPLPKIFYQFYQEELKDYPAFVVWEAVMNNGNKKIMDAAMPFYQKVFGTMPLSAAALGITYDRPVRAVRTLYRQQFLDKKALFYTGLLLVSTLTPLIDREKKMITYTSTGWGDRVYESKRWIATLPVFGRYFEGLSYWETDEEFIRAFSVAWAFEKAGREGRKRRDFVPAGDSIGGREATMTRICPYWFLKAYHMELIEEDVLCRALMEYFAREDSLKVFCKTVKKDLVKPGNQNLLMGFFGERLVEEILEKGEAYVAEDTWIGALLRKLYDKIVPVLVDTELRRGEAETIFTWDMRGITYIEGIDYLVRILMALGKDTLSRETYYSAYYGSNQRSKQDVLSSLLNVCYPKAQESGADLKAALKKTSVEAQRLVEVAMYAPQWVDIIQDCLGWKGLKSGCYYFMAHMNEWFDDQKKAIIAKYTPLTSEELQDGAFDAAWFEEAYGLLGKAHFDKLYQAAKYISDGQKHSRARKYADAATGKVKKNDLRKEIEAKRNKDLLMSYGLIPFGRNKKKDIIERYQFIEQFRKESKQFGAQRRASETKAAEIALLNLSVRAGYEDVTRLKMTVEAQLAETYAPLMAWKEIEDVELCLQVDNEGQSRILCRKKEKELKSIPSRLSKNLYVSALKAASKTLKEQYRRTRKMMEESMESGAGFYGSELLALFQNPVVNAILQSLVFLYKEQFGFLKKEKDTLYLETIDRTHVPVDLEEKMILAHPFHFYQAGNWHLYQKYLFAGKIRQPFKQVFRELYTKIPEELGLKVSRMFAGNQIQPKMTVGCLKGRRWVADYEEGLQKIYYKENIIARIYALADWFSPADIEAPTLEWVEFADRKTFQALTIQEVPDLIYSEVMRDVDLAVSVAHAGGVDPESSHSTIEMRQAIVRCSLELFGLHNVTLKESHALIQGSRANYNVHLGSGVVHQEGGAMLHILPVHSQQRGRIFLPFVDEDPKTAEVLSKIILLAEDNKLKDPSILEQIH